MVGLDVYMKTDISFVLLFNEHLSIPLKLKAEN